MRLQYRSLNFGTRREPCSMWTIHRRYRINPLLVALLALLALTGAAAEQTETQRLNTWLDEQYEQQLQFSPISLTFQGRKDRNDEVDDLSYAAFEKQLNWLGESVAAMEKNFDYDRLDSQGKLSWDLWKNQYEMDLAGKPFFYNGFAFDQFSGLHTFGATFLISFHEVASPADLEAYIARIAGLGKAIDQQLVNARKASQMGVVLPGFLIDGVIEQSRKVVTGAPFTEGDDSDLLADFRRKASALEEQGMLTEAEVRDLTAQAEEALVAALAPAYERLIGWIESQRSRSPEQATGVHNQPDGGDYYAYQLKLMTTTDLSASEIHQIGLSEVARLQGEMKVLLKELEFPGDLNEFFAVVRDDKDDERLYYPDTDAGRQAYIDDATAAIENIKSRLPDYFGILPKADLVVKRVEPFREVDGAAQHYFMGTPDGARPGIYYAHLSDMTAMPRYELEVIAYHEGLPGHHMQISIAQELTGIPLFRTQARVTAYSEGWGLYSELLAKEIPGTYADPYSEFGRLNNELWRAIRLVVDTGLHHKGWTEQQAVDYINLNSPRSEQATRAEVQRYIVLPGQATSYKIGMLKIQELRRLAEDRLGENFDIRAFHDAILDGGALPLTLLERKIEDWITAQET